MKLYAYAISAQKYIDESGYIGRTISTVGGCLAQNEDEATGRALRTAWERWPQAEGYHQHQANVVQVPDDMILEAAADLQGEED